jgi:hypothetical protein
MSKGHQAKISQCSRRNSTSTLSYVGSNLPRWRLFLLGPWDEPKLSWSLGLRQKPDLAGIDLRRVVHYDRFLL